jgi:hypothetical protein
MTGAQTLRIKIRFEFVRCSTGSGSGRDDGLEWMHFGEICGLLHVNASGGIVDEMGGFVLHLGSVVILLIIGLGGLIWS